MIIIIINPLKTIHFLILLTVFPDVPAVSPNFID